MPSFQYIAIDKNGKQKKGSIEATGVEKVSAALKADGNIPIKITEQNILTQDINIHIGNPVKPRDLAVFCRQFHSIIAAGVTIIRALEMLSEQTENKVLKKAIKETQLAIEKGDTLGNAMRRQTGVFPSMLINMVDAAEASGSIETCLDRMSIHFEKGAKLNSILKKAMIYPIAVSIIALGVIVLMLVVVIPNFTSVLNDINGKLPPITIAVINTSNFMIHYWYILLVAVIAIALLFRMYKASDSGKMTLSKIALKLPLFGKLIIKTASGNIGRTLSTLIAAGLALPNAVEITAKGISNIILRNILMDAKKEIERGIPLSNTLSKSHAFPPMVYHMIKIGEETGNMEHMLDKLAEYYEEEVAAATEGLIAALEPLIIVVLALIVGVILMAIFQPMMSIYGSLETA